MVGLGSNELFFLNLSISIELKCLLRFIHIYELPATAVSSWKMRLSFRGEYT